MNLQASNVFRPFLAVDGGGQVTSDTPTTARRTRPSFQGLGGSGATSFIATKLYPTQRVSAMSGISPVMGQTGLREARLLHFRVLVEARLEEHGVARGAVDLDRCLAPSQRQAIGHGRYPREALERLAEAIALVGALWHGRIPAGWTAAVQCARCGAVPAPPELRGNLDRCPWCPPREAGRRVPRITAASVAVNAVGGGAP